MTGMQAGIVAAAIVLAGSVGAAGVADAAQRSAMDQAELNQLTPQVRQDVEARLVDGQTVHGVLETRLLNQVSDEFANQKVVATDFQRGDLVTTGPDGKTHVTPFNVTTLLVRK